MLSVFLKILEVTATSQGIFIFSSASQLYCDFLLLPFFIHLKFHRPIDSNPF